MNKIFLLIGIVFGFCIYDPFNILIEYLSCVKGDQLVWTTFILMICFYIVYDIIKYYLNTLKKKKFIKQEIGRIYDQIDELKEDFENFRKMVNNQKFDNIKKLHIEFTEKNISNDMYNIYCPNKSKKLREILDTVKYIRKHLPYKQSDSYFKIYNKHVMLKYDSRGIEYSDCYYKVVKQTGKCFFCEQHKKLYEDSIDTSIEELNKLKQKIKDF